MKRIFACVLVLTLLVSSFAISANAAELTRTVEHLSDGSYYVIEVEESNSLARASKTGMKSATYYTANDVKVFTVRVTGTFSYTSGVSATAVSQSVDVILHQSSARIVDYSSRRSGATVYGSGIVSYGGLTISKSVNLTCDKYGNLS